LVFGAVYLPPNSPFQSYDSNNFSVQEVLSIHSPHSFILCGDYNFSNINWASDNLGFIATGALTSSLSYLADSFSLNNFSV